MKTPTHLLIEKSVAKSDWKLRLPPQDNNGRKVVVNTIYPKKEKPIEDPKWKPGPDSELTPVLETGVGGIEVATFTHEAGQDRHKHRIATEIYVLLEGEMTIKIADKDVPMEAGDEIIVLPGVAHEVVVPEKEEDVREFLCRVHTINCYGDIDKYVEQHDQWVQVQTLKAQRIAESERQN